MKKRIFHADLYFSAGAKPRFYIISGLLLLFLSIGFWNLLPEPLFNDPTSTVLFDRNQELLGARIADDGQWRFPEPDSVSSKFRSSIISFEDQYFMYHPGFNPASLLRATIQNVRERKIVSGGSTLSMQVIRLSRKGKPRTVKEKIIEIIMATCLEMKYTKDEILSFYCGNAPFGGNVVGLETAAWRYYNRSPANLSWAESAMLAVLPNSPALIHPGRNRQALEEKRNRLLTRLMKEGLIDSMSMMLACREEIPEKPGILPDEAYHLMQDFEINTPGKRINSTIDKTVQEKVNRIFQVHKQRLYANQIRNAACLIIDVSQSEVISYVGNIRNPERPEYGGDVDVLRSRRSTGSILKPFLYAVMQYRGEILPETLVPDIPTRYNAYSPKNYNKEYDGVVDAATSLSRSLNVPTVRMLNQYGIDRFIDDLKMLGFSTIDYSSEHYGLSLILGGAEVTLWDLAKVYTSFSRVLNSYSNSDGNYFQDDWDDLHLIRTKISKREKSMGSEQGYIGAGAVWLTFEALRKVNRPDSETGWENFSSSRKVAWKTGTSFGFRDGWAVACTPEYTVAVWVGNSDGEGRPGLTGITAAAPLLFDLLNILPRTSWYQIPHDDLRKTIICRESGHKAGRFCEHIDSVYVSPAGLHTLPCPYHIPVHLDAQENFRVSSECYPVSKMKTRNWFILPPAQEYYYQRKNSSYKLMPPLSPDCKQHDDIAQIQIIYPDPGSRIYIPRELDGQRGKVVFEAAHRNRESTIFWSVDDEFIQQTKDFHQISVQPAKGKHILTLVDQEGNKEQVSFEVIDH